MSFRITGGVSRSGGSVIGDALFNPNQGALDFRAMIAERLTALHDELLANLQALSPVDTGALELSAFVDTEAMTIKIGVAMAPRGDGKNYGWFQEVGWHDARGAFHEGHHMVELTWELAKEEMQSIASDLASRGHVSFFQLRDSSGRFAKG